MWQRDFACKWKWTIKRMFDLYFLLFTYIETKRPIWVSPCTDYPTGEWITQQARNFAMHVESHGCVENSIEIVSSDGVMRFRLAYFALEPQRTGRAAPFVKLLTSLFVLLLPATSSEVVTLNSINKRRNSKLQAFRYHKLSDCALTAPWLSVSEETVPFSLALRPKPSNSNMHECHEWRVTSFRNGQTRVTQGQPQEAGRMVFSN